jgi:hypothetical protein
MSGITATRLHNQRIENTCFSQPEDAAAWLGALQGQDYAGAKWSVGLRLREGTEAEVEGAIAGKRLARTWLMRGTLHVAAATDVTWMLALLGPRIIASNARRYRELELDGRSLARGNDVLVRALEGRQQRTRKELFAILEEQGISTHGQRGVHLLQRASLDGLICQGVAERNNPTFYRVDEWLPAQREMTREEALAELARRYFLSRGPATLQDFMWWSGLRVADARAGLEAMRAELLEETIEGERYWRSPAVPGCRDTAARVHLLPGFDEYLLGYRARGAVLDPQYEQRVCPGKNGVFSPTIVSDGRVVGTWKRAFKKGRVVIIAVPFSTLGDDEIEALEVASRRYGEFVGAAATVEVLEAVSE